MLRLSSAMQELINGNIEVFLERGSWKIKAAEVGSNIRKEASKEN